MSSLGKPTLRLDPEAQQPGHDQVEAWRENVEPLWEVAAGPEAAARFRGASEVHHLGRAILGRTQVTGHRTRRSKALIARTGVDHVIVQTRAFGKFHLETEGRSIDAEPGDICLFDMTRPMTAWSTDYSGVTLALPRSLFALAVKDVDALHGGVIRASSGLGAIASEHLRALGRHADAMSPQDAAAAVQGTAALMAACAGPSVIAAPEARNASRPAVLLAVRQHIESHLASPDLHPDGLARRFGVSRSALYRLFQPLGGVNAYVRRRRLARAYGELAGADGVKPQIQALAWRYGFEDAASFSRAFRAEFGVAPIDVRDGAPGRAGPGAAVPGGGSGDLYKWVVELAA